MFKTKTLLSLALLLPTLCAFDASAQEARGAQEDQARRAQTEGAFAFAFGGGNHLGVSVEGVTRENMGGLNLSGEPRGVVVREVSKDSPAAKAGLQKNDVLLRFDGEQISSAQKLQRLINESAPEHTARLTISRNGAEQELSVTLGKRGDFSPQAFGNFNFPDVQAFGLNSENFKRQAEEFQRNSKEWQGRSKEWKERAKELELNSQEMRRNLEEKFRADGLGNNFGNNFTFVFGGEGRRIGITTQELTGQLADYFGVSERGGLLVTSVAENSPASKAGLKAGDVVTEVDGTQLRNAGELSRAINRRDEGEVTLTIKRDRKTRTIKVTPDRTQNNPMLYTPGGIGRIAATAPRALIAPHVNVVPMRALGAMPPTPARPATPSLAPFAAPRPQAAPRIYVTPATPARRGVWIL
ncbi:MAG TPA: PDZ domain-containing protein [Pyrinomonadaceae bacterium]|jgi:membrane-associated protease RseP (regulator of RpoE activity)|nr:PDZ domain-containing protein [Pyrinomonadaceae bacterium]